MKISNRLALVAISIFASLQPALAQFDRYQELAYVPRQGALNFLSDGYDIQFEAIESPSVWDLARLSAGRVSAICENNPDGEIVNWFGKVRSVDQAREKVKVELIIAEKASLVAILPADSAVAADLGKAVGRWVKFDGTFTAGKSCLTQIPPLTLASALRPAYLGNVTSVTDTVTPRETELLEIALPGEAWAEQAE